MWDTAAGLRGQELVVAVLCAVADVVILLVLCPRATSSAAGYLVVLLILAADLALATPARFCGPVAAGHAALQVVGPVLLTGVGGYPGANETGLLVAGYRAGAWLGLREAGVVLGVLLVCALLGRALFPPSPLAGDWRLVTAHTLTTVLLPWLVGRTTTARRGLLAELERREADRQQEAQDAVRRAVAEERTAIARDLHDVISHHVSAIGVHAGAARLSLAGAPDRVGPSLSAVETASRSAMVDLRRLLDLLHHGDGAARQPGLDDLDELVRGTRAAGLPTTLTTAGPDVALPPSVDVALYRIAQEALTNALRHGGGRGAAVALARTPADVVLTVDNDLPAAPGATRGPTRRGLSGIRRRAALFGAEVTCGPDGGRWVVRVRVPLEAR
ncbi:sensor histidine kinase [Actinokineospora bangkokensis]|uniref:histidine kinase n=1 Tax=Actinokineospora bangkokensis TaxID=1193682 RepID=A0A1Q9LKX6_9PSEU|nr:histidine kinase [Actinokineospora bangkokensis]OLR92644.1 hypothetical protein BJP25_21650 [Actinokineospora bangkokensis]